MNEEEHVRKQEVTQGRATLESDLSGDSLAVRVEKKLKAEAAEKATAPNG